jgi:DNA polymerase-3 subunit epsilon
MPTLLLARLRNRWTRNRFRGKDLNPTARANLAALDHLNPNENAKNQRYVVFDLETTGLDLTKDRVLSVAAFRVIDGRLPFGDLFCTLVNPSRSIPSSSIKVHGIVPDMVADAPEFGEVFDQFLHYLGTDILVGYHVRFDLHFLNLQMKRTYGFSLQNLVLDVEQMCRNMVFPKHLGSYALRFRSNPSLDEVARHFGVEIHERHTAVGDALATAMIFQRILAGIEKPGPGRLRNLLPARAGI